jgi:hypothetical protein
MTVMRKLKQENGKERCRVGVEGKRPSLSLHDLSGGNKTRLRGLATPPCALCIGGKLSDLGLFEWPNKLRGCEINDCLSHPHVRTLACQSFPKCPLRLTSTRSKPARRSTSDKEILETRISSPQQTSLQMSLYNRIVAGRCPILYM